MDIEKPENDVIMEEVPNVLEENFKTLYSSNLLEKRKNTEENELPSFSNMMNKINEAHHEYLKKQTKQNVLEKIGHAESLEKLRELLSGSKENTNQTLEKAKKQLEAAYLERIKAMSNITRLAQEIDQEKKRFLQVEANTPTHDQEVAKLTEQWKELQKQNAEKRAALEARMNVSISSANDCKDILHNQTQTIQKLSEQQKSLEDKKIDLSTQVKNTKEDITLLKKKILAQTNDLEGKQRNKEFESLQDIQAWYKNMRGVLKSITGIEVDRFEGESSLVLVVLDEYYVHAHFCPETNAFKHAEFSPDTIISKDLVEYAVKYDNFPYLVREYRQRILMQKTLESHLQELARMYFVSTSQPDGTVRISVTNGFGLVIKIPAEYPSKSNKLFLDALLPESEAAKLIDLVTQKNQINSSVQEYTLVTFVERAMEHLNNLIPVAP